MVFEICAIIATIVFTLLVIYIIRTLCVLQKTLKSIDHATKNIDDKIQQMDSTVKTFSHMADICEEKAKLLKKRELYRLELENRNTNYTEDFADIAVVGLKLLAKYLRR